MNIVPVFVSFEESNTIDDEMHIKTKNAVVVGNPRLMTELSGKENYDR